MIPPRLSTPSKRTRHQTRSAQTLFSAPRFHLPVTENVSYSPLPTDSDRASLRRQLRLRRRSLTPAYQRRAAQRLAQRMLASPALLKARHVALYLPHNGEINPTPLITTLHRRGIALYLPVLRPFTANQLWFVRLTPATRLTANRFGILEPLTRDAAYPKRRIPAWALSALLVPLVGFDRYGGRLGMGGGFYDRTLAFTRNSDGARPMLFGVAHDEQEVVRIPMNNWDVPLDAIVTPRHWWQANQSSARSTEPQGRS
ncbi:5-formyltetrahydrofolate cyclo-ligase family [Carnimonas sp. R-84981]|uniref:5-formyltetrahydrofolate cyclo-ligase n=1 Tax=Carnimonas bestiolae TaxID=3402172 RepID=UPI003EDB8A69